jgi:broad specificity phosphatase PhoE
MPIDLVLVRHGQSEGNRVYELNKEAKLEGKNIVDIIGKEIHSQLLGRHSSVWRLTDKGIWQARCAGKWLRENGFFTFDRAFVSEYLRAQETAGYLGLDNVMWYRDLNLRERDWGQLENVAMLPPEEEKYYLPELRRLRRDGYFGAPPGGESMAHLSLRTGRVNDTLHRDCSNERVIMVCHGEVMMAYRVYNERMSQARFRVLDMSEDPFDIIHNAQILHYTRRNPQTDELAPHLMWFRSICPWDMNLSRNIWEEIKRPKFTNEELLAEAAAVPRLIN